MATDQGLEQTINKDGKSRGGVFGLTLRKGALTRWLQTRHITAEYVEAFRSLCGTKCQTSRHHPDLAKSCIMRDEQDVCKIVQAVSQFQNPFQLDSVPSKLINIATGQVASDQVGNSLKAFLDDGRKKLDDFVRHRLLQSCK